LARYKPGDRVVVRPDLRGGVLYKMLDSSGESNDATEEMIELADKVVTIVATNGQYRIYGSSFNWTDEMFLGLESNVYGEDIVAPDIDELFL
jgi:hypothetical protein